MVTVQKITLQGFKSFKRKTAIPFPTGFSVITGPNGAGKSCRGDTQVLLATGEVRPIKYIVEEALGKAQIHLQLDDGVFTYENPSNMKVLGLDVKGMKIVDKDISAFIKRRGEKNLYNIITNTGREVTTTGCHPVMIFRNGEIVSEVVSRLNEGDLIATPRRLELPENIYEINGLSIGENFARLVGYLVGDGYIACNRVELVNSEDAILEDFEKLAAEFSLHVKYKKNVGKATRVICWGEEFPNLMKELFRSDSTRHLTTSCKTVPKEIMFSRRSVAANFLAGLFDCDATVRKESPTFEYTTKNEVLANQVQTLLLRFGIVSRKKMKMRHATNTKAKIKRPYFCIIVEGQEKLKTLMDSIPMRSALKAGRLRTICSRGIRPGNNIDVLPKETNAIIRECANLLGVQIKPLRKPCPWLAAYTENRCCPTRPGVNKAAAIFKEKAERLKLLADVPAEKAALMDALRAMNVRACRASKSIGLNKGTITAHWIYGDAKIKKERLEDLRKFVERELKSRLDESDRLISVLKNLASSDIFWDRISAINSTGAEEWVYDLTIPNCHNFIGNNIFVHNSNINDAFSFVLGIRSSRELRASQGADLIYKGSKTKDESDYALVSLTLDNSRKLLPVEDGEVVISRKLNKHGISTYRMNGRVVTKQHMAAILAQARIHADGHNIIKQGDVNQIVEMDSVERRQILDELCGIREYDEKKAKAIKELEAIDAKVKEAEILLNEKGSIVAKLKQERDAALAYREMNAELEKIKASIIWKENEETGGELGSADKKIGEKNAEMSKLDVEVSKLDVEIDGYEREFEEMTKQVVKASSRMEETNRLVKLQAEADRLRDKIESNERESIRLTNMSDRLRGMDDRLSPAAKGVAGMKGVFGTLSELITVPRYYRVAAEVAAGSHMQDIVVDSMDTAVSCVKKLKESRTGRARFIPLDKISSGRGALPSGAIGWMSNLVKFDQKYAPAVLYALGSTACVDGIDRAKSLAKSSRTRMVTLDGDLIESSGAVIGGFYSKKVADGRPEIGQCMKEKGRLEDENIALEKRLRELNAELEKLADKDRGSFRLTFEKDRIRLDEKMKAAKSKRAAAYDRKLAVQQEIGRLNIQKARLEAKYDNAKAQLESFEGGGKEISPKELKPFVDMNLSKLRADERDTIMKLNSLGQINFKAIEEFESIRGEFEDFRQKVDKIVEEKNKIVDTITKIESKRLETFSATLGDVSKHFKDVYGELAGGEASLSLEVPNDINSGLSISAAPEGKKLLSIDSLSGGEKTLTAFAFLFALKKHRPSPFYILDEADAALDKENTKKVVGLLKRHSVGSQFIIISHNDHMVKEADRVYGVTMNEGESKVIAIELPPIVQKEVAKNN